MTRRMLRMPVVVSFLMLLGVGVAAAQGTPAERVQKVLASPGYAAAVAVLDREHERIVDETIMLSEIPAPPFKEASRGKAYLDLLKAHGLSDVEQDAEGNVMGLRKGSGGGPLLVMSAHLDTVFPAETDVQVKRKGTRLYGPGIGDDSRSLAVLLGYIRAMDEARIRTKADILFVATVGEEGQGDLRGVRYFFNKGKYKDKAALFFSMDGTNAERITNGGVGSKRYKVTFKGPGGHSYGAFGIVNPMTAMSQAVVEFYKTAVPANPRTTFSASVTEGGTSVNSIPNSVSMEFDMRSESADVLGKLEQRFLSVIAQAVETENNARSTHVGAVSADIKLIGDRPAGKTDEKADLVQVVVASVAAHGIKPELGYSSTDSNTPMSLGIPAVTIGSGGKGDRSHSLDEWIDVEKTSSLKGMTISLTTLLAAAGME